MAIQPPNINSNQIIITLNQPCACNYPNADAYELCVLLLAREYQATLLKFHQKALMQISEILFVSLPPSVKGKLSLYTLALISPAPRIILDPYPGNGTIKDWMHEYDIHLEDVVEEIHRIEKRLVELRAKNLDEKIVRKLEELDKKFQRNLIVKSADTTEKEGTVKCGYVPKREKLTVDSIKRFTKDTMEKYRASLPSPRAKEMGNVEEEEHDEYTPPDLEFLSWLSSFDPPSDLLDQPIPESILKGFMETENRGFDARPSPPSISNATCPKMWTPAKSEAAQPQAKIGRKRKVGGSVRMRAGFSGMTNEEKERIAEA
ncbi:hypothetical protein I302_104712 [Kwoniella bestiolae CBS 10118]|uniref:Uncharacterized protein n=1 Tax=Kwoniella bestiolae CBS 10118 TaxID=1296100 RepID=A0A1B9FRZ8_9TREE|nr:hypothetical protein I302_09217 [Kwoniella bestiolae CBS 10118]OCF21538.1 hypothetical protein I302_09217 [Kwoniella bestiolae CBS 10118]